MISMSITSFVEVVSNVSEVWISDWSFLDRKSTRLNSSHLVISYAVFCLKKKKNSKLHCGIHLPNPSCYVDLSVALSTFYCCDLAAHGRVPWLHLSLSRTDARLVRHVTVV